MTLQEQIDNRIKEYRVDIERILEDNMIRNTKISGETLRRIDKANGYICNSADDIVNLIGKMGLDKLVGEYLKERV